MKTSGLILKLTFFIILYSICYACIKEYEHTTVGRGEPLLVVDGTITNDTTKIILNKSINLEETYTGFEYIPDACIYVEGDDGNRTENGIHVGDGVYLISTGILNPEVKYRLFISLKNKEYTSSFLSLLITPEIERITPTKKGKGEPVYICVSTEDKSNQSPYYRWTYKEHWEVQAPLFANYGNEIIHAETNSNFYDLLTLNNKYYCWGADSSKIMILESTTRLQENKVSLKKLVEIPCSDDKLSILYYIAVEQMLIRKEAYEYFNHLQKNIEQIGGLFSQMPSEIKGNIHCITHPEEIIIGYIEVTTIEKRELFLPKSDELYEKPRNTCSVDITTDAFIGYPVYIYNNSVGSPNYYAPTRCVDCRAKYNASKNKPYFWPNNHL